MSTATDATYDNLEELQGFSFSESEADSADYEAVVPIVMPSPQYRPRLRREPSREPHRAAHAAPDEAAAASLLVAVQRTNQLLTALLHAARLHASELGALSAQLAEQRPHLRRAPR